MHVVISVPSSFQFDICAVYNSDYAVEAHKVPNLFDMVTAIRYMLYGKHYRICHQVQKMMGYSQEDSLRIALLFQQCSSRNLIVKCDKKKVYLLLEDMRGIRRNSAGDTEEATSAGIVYGADFKQVHVCMVNLSLIHIHVCMLVATLK